VRNDLLQEVMTLRTEVAQLKAIVLGKEATIRELASAKKGSNLDERVTVILHDLKVPANLKGFKFLREAIQLVYHDSGFVGGFVKELYPAIAKKFFTTPSRVERAIRHAIECSYARNFMHSFYQNHYAEHKPTNSQFIVDITDQLMLEDQQVKKVQA
jgi:two-component system response regulator (stage 0 sporulation protein A)